MAKLVGYRLRLLPLALVWSAIVIVLVHSWLAPKSAKSYNSTAPSLSATIPVPNWKLETVSSSGASSDVQDKENTDSAMKHYQYQQKNRTLSIDMQLMQGDGKVSRFVSVYSPIQAGNAKMLNGQRYLSQVGHYSVLTHEKKAYLTACINPVGDSTVTEPQFRQSRFKALHLGQIIGWFLSQSPLVDDRCLWTLMSLQLPADKAKGSDRRMAESTYRELETVWVAWYHWWKANFPPY